MTILNQQQIRYYAQKAGLLGNALDIATAIAMAESGGDTNAVNPGSQFDKEFSVGLWQINVLAHPQYSLTQMKDPTQNALAMYSISSGGNNWNPWGTYTNGSYKKFLSNIQGNNSPFAPAVFPQQNVNVLTNTSVNPVVETDTGSGYKYVLAYTVAIAILILISKSRLGYNAIYYALVLCILLLFVTQAKFIAGALAPITQPQQNQNVPASTG